MSCLCAQDMLQLALHLRGEPAAWVSQFSRCRGPPQQPGTFGFTLTAMSGGCRAVRLRSVTAPLPVLLARGLVLQTGLRVLETHPLAPCTGSLLLVEFSFGT